MQILKRSTAWLMVLCLMLGLTLSVGPVAPKANAAGYDPYVFYFGPASSLVPSYYRDSARRFVGWSSHMLYEDYEGYQIVQLFNMTNVTAIEPTQPANFAQDKRYASESAFCADLGVSYVYGHNYRAINLEDAHFGNRQDTVKHIRAIVRHCMPNIANAAVIQKAANEYHGGQEVKNLTNAELGSAVQAALWYYANNASYGYYNEPYVWTADFNDSVNASYKAQFGHLVSTSDPLDAYETGTYYSEDNVNKVFEYLINLPGENAHDIIIGSDALTLGKSTFTGNVHSGDLTLFVDIEGIVDADDKLMLSAKCGDKSETVALGKGGIAATAEGLFPITISGVDAENCSQVDLELTGTQTVNDAVFFEAKPIGSKSARYSSQGMTGYGANNVPIEAAATVTPNITLTSVELTKVDAQTGNPLSGVSFDLYMKQEGNDLKLGSYTTDADGKITATVTASQEYYFVETKALEGYEAITGSIAPGSVSNSWSAGSLEVSKKLINETPAQPGETFNFKLTLDLSTAPLMSNGISWMTADYLKNQLESSKALSWTLSGNKIAAAFTLKADETVKVDGIPLGATYTLEEVMTDEDREWFTVTTQIDGSTLQKGNTAQGTIAAKNAVLFTNSVVDGEAALGELAVSKKLVNTTPAQVGETFNFKITLDLSNADALESGAPWMDEAYLMSLINCSEDLTWTEESGKYTATFTVDADETVTVKGIAQGTTYTVEEMLTAEDREWFTVTSKVDNQSAQNSHLAGGTVAEKNAVLFTNTVSTTDVQFGDLNVSKKLVNTTPAQVGETFDFKITLDLSEADAYDNAAPWLNDEYLLGKISSTENLTWTDTDGKYTATFTVDADETVVIKGIAQGTAYTVEEVLTAEDRSWFTVTSKVGNEDTQNSNIAEGSIASLNAILFTNTVVTADVQLGDLNVSKKLVNTTPAVVGETFNFQITIDLSTADAYNSAAPWLSDEYLLGKISSTEALTWTEKDGKYTATFTVDADETVTIKGLAYGTTYTVEEVLTAEDRTWFTVTTKVNNEASQSSDTAQGTVAALNGVLFTNTVVTGDELRLGDLSVSKKLVNTTPAVVGETFNFRITIDLSTADAYQNAAPWLNDEYLLGKISSTEALTWTEKDGKYTATFTVDADETVIINGIAYGATYKVEELLTAQDREKFTVTSQVNSETEKNSDTAAGTVAQRNAVVFTNSVVTCEVEAGALTVSKKLVNTTPAQVGETFNFKITVDLSTANPYTDPVFWMNDEYLLGLISSTENLTWTEKDGKYTATFTVDADETVTISGIAQGTTYTVEELLTAEECAQFTVTSQVGNNAAQNSSTAQGSIASLNAVLFINTVVAQDVELGSLNVSKKLVNTTPAQVGETFNFQITIDLSTADVYTDAAFWMNDEYLLGLISSTETLTWTEVSGKYTATFTVDADETVTVSGIAQGTTYTVEEILTAEDRAWFTVTSQVGNNAAQNSSTAQGSIAAQNAVLFTNTVVTGPELKFGDPSVSKKLINTTPAEVRETFSFQITMDFSTADVYTNAAPWMNDEYLMSFISGTEELTWTQKDGKYTATFTVNAEETFTVTGVAYGTTYTVEEILTEEDRERFTVTWQIGDGHAMDSDTLESTVSENNDIVFTNTVVTQDVELGSLNVSKKLINTTPAEVGETFNFQITLDLSEADAYADPVFWMSDEYLLGLISSTETLTWTEKDGKHTATFTVDADETVTISGIAQGTTYTLEEILTAEECAQFTVTSQVGNEAAQNGTIAEGSVAELNAVLFTNSVVTQNVELGDLDISKKLVNTTPAQVGETFNFQITLDLSTADVYANPVFWMNDDYLMSFIDSTEALIWTAEGSKYIASFTVNADETVTIRSIPQGATYTVREILTEEEREWFKATAQVGDGETVESIVAQSTVAERNAVIFTNSVVTTEVELGSLSVSKKLVNTTPAKVGETFNFRITLDLSEADVYTDPVFWMNDDYLMSFISSTEELIWTAEDGKYTATFTVDADETVTIDGIAQGAAYTVQEILTEEDRAWFTTTSQIGEEEAKASDTVESTVAGENAVLFTNCVVTGPDLAGGDLTVTKKLTKSSRAKTGESFSFQISLDLAQADAYQNPAPWMYDEYLLDQIKTAEDLTWTKTGEKKYTATFTLKADETLVLSGVPQGTGYTLEETLDEAVRKFYKVTVAVATDGGEGVETVASMARGRISGENDVTFTNEYLEPIPVTADLSLSVPVVLCLLSVLMGAVLMLTKGRFIG